MSWVRIPPGVQNNIIMANYDWEIALEHQLIRETVGYDVISKIDILDLPVVMNFLQIVKNYTKINSLLNEKRNG